VGRALVLFTRDLRVHDNPALATAAREHDTLMPAFVFDRELLRRTRSAPNRLAFLLTSLRDLDGSLRERGARLVLRDGDVVEQAMRLAHEAEITCLYMSADCTPYARARHERLARACERERIELRTVEAHTVVPPGAITPPGGDHYRVFTPYWRVWRTLPRRAPVRAPARIAMARPRALGRLPSLAALTDERPSAELQQGGERAARRRLESWLRSGLAHYERDRDLLADDATSRLSAYLHFGCLSPTALLGRVDGRPGAEAFVRQLCWRDFHHQVLSANPQMPRRDYRSHGDRWRRDARAARAWREGRTGYPIVDAGMRQLRAEGYMHNRARLIVASFLTKTLYLDWRLGAAHFARLLLDADVADNVGNWQWVAGTGNDTRPNRLLNPLRQAHRYDPHGDYVRRYVPELANLEAGSVHEPWKLDGTRRVGRYPQPIVELSAAAAEFRARRRR
jgi:deoxyribodipyrimidine photo-lyase